MGLDYSAQSLFTLRLRAIIIWLSLRTPSPSFFHANHYRRVIRKLIHLTITKPNLAFLVHTLAQFMQAPTIIHWEAALRGGVHYLKCNSDHGILLKSASLSLFASCNSN